MTVATQPCDCGPEDGDYGSGYHFQSCPKAPAQAAAMIRAEHRGHYSDVVMDCPLCVIEWKALGGKA